MSRTLFIPFIVLLFLGLTSPSFATNSPTIELDAAVHFLTPGGEDVLLHPDPYQVDAVALKGEPGGEQPGKASSSPPQSKGDQI